ncbi:MAG: hypothetical protein KDE19_11625 [Caldilineaceae bacterium]|nr:hypothetical protein [Caldilineaceae bacterium]
MLTLALALAAGAFQPLAYPGIAGPDLTHLLGSWAYLLDGLTVALVGALIAARRPQHPVGWLLCLAGLGANGEAFCQQYAIYALILHPRVLPWGIFILWLSQWLWNIPNTMLCLILMLFPTGRFLGAMWRWIARTIALGGATLVLLSMFVNEMTFSDYPNLVPNPIGLFNLHDSDLMWPFTLYTGCILLAAVSALIWRYLRAQGIERQQMKWFAYAALLDVVVGLLLEIVFPGRSWSGLAENLTVLGIPIAIAIAILQHRLFDIDLIIRRTLLYTLLSLTLAVLYFGCVLVLETVVRSLTGQAQSQWVTVLSTLAIAALFSPLRRRVQAGIDRRFYRGKYDAEQVLAAFAETVRNETDLQELSAQLVAVTRETMQPTNLSLWLKPIRTEAKELFQKQGNVSGGQL